MRKHVIRHHPESLSNRAGSHLDLGIENAILLPETFSSANHPAGETEVFQHKTLVLSPYKSLRGSGFCNDSRFFVIKLDVITIGREAFIVFHGKRTIHLLFSPIVSGHPFGCIQFAGIKFLIEGEIPFFNLLKGIFFLRLIIPYNLLGLLQNRIFGLFVEFFRFLESCLLHLLLTQDKGIGFDLLFKLQEVL